MTNKRNGTLYTGVTSDLIKRVWQRRAGVAEGFTNRHACKTLVWYEAGGDMEHAILREKQIEAGSRAKKLGLIEAVNPDWRDLWPDIAHPVARHCEPSEALQPAHWIAARLRRSQ